MVSIENIKIVLVNIESNTGRIKRQFSPHFGILAAASELRKQNIDVSIKHIIEDDKIENTLFLICQGAFAVGFSTMTSSNLLPTIRATKYVKSLGLYTFLGSIYATLLLELSLKESSLNAVLRGEVESNLYQFVLRRLGKIDSNSVNGLCFKNNIGDIIVNYITLPVAENELSFHSFDLLDLTAYYEKDNLVSNRKNFIDKKMLPYMTSMGCNKMSSFIEIDLMKLSTEFIERAKKANIDKLFISIESGSDEVLKHIKKGITSKLMREKVEMCSKHNMNIELSFMMLFPNESVDDLRKTFDLVDELSLYDNVSIAGPKIYSPYPETSMYNDSLISDWSVPATNEERSKFERNISPSETIFNLTYKHLELLKSRRLV